MGLIYEAFQRWIANLHDAAIYLAKAFVVHFRDRHPVTVHVRDQGHMTKTIAAENRDGVFLWRVSGRITE